jgi:hypothetical protein
MNRCKLPQELINIITDNLRDEPWVLRRCSLVCSSWLQTNQCHLFRCIVLQPPNARYDRRPGDISNSQKLHRILLKSPHIATYIQELQVYEGQMFRDQDWIGTDQTLPLVLGMLTHLRKIELRRLRWSKFLPDLRRSICSVLERPSLVFLAIDLSNFASMDDFSSLLSHADGLTGISFTNINTSHSFVEHPLLEDASLSMEPKEPEVGHRRSHLLDVYLNLNDYPKFFDWLLGPQSPWDVSRIHTLHISNFRQHDANAVNRLLPVLSSSLRHFKLDMPMPWELSSRSPLFSLIWIFSDNPIHSQRAQSSKLTSGVTWISNS